MLESLLLVGEREDWTRLRDEPNVYMFAQELRIILPALFKVDANPCNVALFGSTPRVSEKSLDSFPGQHMSCSNESVLNE